MAQPDNGRKVNQSFALKLRDQFFPGFVLRFAGDGAEQTAGGFLERLHRAIGKRVAFRAPKFPADVARHILGVEFQAIEHDARRLHDIVADSVPGHPRNFVFSHRITMLSASITTRKWRPLNSLIYAGKLLSSEQKRGEIF